jgi:hypothetical protein
MQALRTRKLVLAVLCVAGLAGTACRRTFVVVPRPAGGYTRVDTLRGVSDGRDVRVIFRFDTLWRRDTVVRLDTMWIGGTRTIVRVDTVLRRDTVVLRAPNPVTTPVRTDSIVLRAPNPVLTPVRVDTVRVVVRDTVVRTIPGGRVDTVRVVVHDTVRLVVRDTIRVAGRRMLYVPPGQYPAQGQCRVWVHDLPPGRQADAAPCNALGTVPAGAFILFGGEAWDADWDWVAEARRSTVPPEIIALSRTRGRP